jgi:hypothetical protein
LGEELDIKKIGNWQKKKSCGNRRNRSGLLLKAQNKNKAPEFKKLQKTFSKVSLI